MVTYLDQDKKAEIGWSDAAQRQAQLNVLVADAQATLELALGQCDDPKVRLVGWLLTKILGDDVEKDVDGILGQGTAEDRIVNLTNPEYDMGVGAPPIALTASKLQCQSTRRAN